MEVESFEDEDMVTRGLRADPIESFEKFGPNTLTPIDWNNLYHRTSVASCLVQAVYILERDRQKKLKGLQSQADPRWWEFFNFNLAKKLEDPDGYIYGAVFDYNHFYGYNNTSHSRPPPRQVIAFRGTIMTSKSGLHDLNLVRRILCGSLLESRRFKHAIDVIQKAVDKTGNETVWLAGHSLGAAVALVAGKTMMRSGFPLESYLFNPPYPTFSIKMLQDEKSKNGVRFLGSLIRAGVAIAFNGWHHHKGKEDYSFMTLGSWRPYLFLNAADPICSRYIDYFNHRGGEGGSSYCSSLHLYLLPSAYLITNCNSKSNSIFQNFNEVHGLNQWWDHMFNGEFVLHQYNH